MKLTCFSSCFIKRCFLLCCWCEMKENCKEDTECCSKHLDKILLKISFTQDFIEVLTGNSETKGISGFHITYITYYCIFLRFKKVLLGHDLFYNLTSFFLWLYPFFRCVSTSRFHKFCVSVCLSVCLSPVLIRMGQDWSGMIRTGQDYQDFSGVIRTGQE